MSSSVPCTCSATLKLISTRLTPSSFSSAGVLLNPPGISSSLISSSRNSVIASPRLLFIAELRKKRPHFLAFLCYPESLRRSFPTAKTVEPVNGQLGLLRRHSGGYCHYEHPLELKPGLAISYLGEARCRRPGRAVCAVLHQLN